MWRQSKHGVRLQYGIILQHKEYLIRSTDWSNTNSENCFKCYCTMIPQELYCMHMFVWYILFNLWFCANDIKESTPDDIHEASNSIKKANCSPSKHEMFRSAHTSQYFSDPTPSFPNVSANLYYFSTCLGPCSILLLESSAHSSTERFIVYCQQELATNLYFLNVLG